MKLSIPDLRFAERLRVPAGSAFSLSALDPGDTCSIDGKDEAREALRRIQKQLDDLQEMLYAQGKYSVLVVLQAMDTGGKDGTIRNVFGPLNPQGVVVKSFKVPTAEELSHDFLWRVHKEVPPRGMIRVFNRSHYEDVLVVRVHGYAPPDVIGRRYDQINAFEQHLADHNTLIIKFMLHISRDEQKKRLQSRIDEPEKRWKFNSGDLKERLLWDRYMEAFELALTRCNPDHAPWYVIPANNKWARDLIVADILYRHLLRLDMKYPQPEEGLDGIVIPD
jgi:PPK2 family polyphosphate:nucleotide phosphotransferase